MQFPKPRLLAFPTLYFCTPSSYSSSSPMIPCNSFPLHPLCYSSSPSSSSYYSSSSLTQFRCSLKSIFLTDLSFPHLQFSSSSSAPLILLLGHHHERKKQTSEGFPKLGSGNKLQSVSKAFFLFCFSSLSLSMFSVSFRFPSTHSFIASFLSASLTFLPSF